MMPITCLNQTFLAITAWKENRGGGTAGMTSVLNVVMNRSRASGRSPYEECVRKWQFSSLTDPKDPQLAVWPSQYDESFLSALSLASAAMNGTLEDITDGAQWYYAVTMKTPPTWAATKTKTVLIAGQVFFK